MYPIIGTHHTLHSSYVKKKFKKKAFSGIYMKQLTEYDGTATSETQPRKNNNNGKGWYFQFDDVMSNRYILWIS